jgi:glycosyltransferase involved in cell wall biosynthesis
MKSNVNASRPLRVVVLMALVSPWSRLIVQRLSALGVVLHIVDFQTRGGNDSYLDCGGPLETAYRTELEPLVAGVYRIYTPRWMVARMAYSAKQLRTIARQHSPDIVLALYGGSNAAVAYLSGVRPYVVYVVGSDVLLASWIQKQIGKVTLASAAAVLANGVHLADRTVELAPKAKVTPLYLGADIERYSLPKNWTTGPTFICTRGFIPVYDNRTIIRALSILDDVPIDTSLSFLSSGPLLPESIAMADRLLPTNLRSKVVFRGGVSDREMKNALDSASFYLSASLSDGTSSSLLEAMACGLLPIVSDIAANREWIVHESNGLLFAPGDHVKLAENIRRAIAGERWMTAARLTNRRLVEERANVDVSMSALLETLDAVRASQDWPSKSAPTVQ